MSKHSLGTLAVKGLRSKCASSAVELVAVVLIMVPIALFALNIGFLAFGSFYNDAACREAARAAGQQTSSDSAKEAAMNALQNYQFAAGFIGAPTISEFKYNFALTPPSPDNPSDTPLPIEISTLKSSPAPVLAGAAGGTAPNVFVKTTMVCGVPAPLLFNSDGLASSITLVSAYTFPILAGVEDQNDNTPDSGPSPDPNPDPNS